MTSSSGTPSFLATDGAAYEIFLGRWTRRLAEPFLDFADLPPPETSSMSGAALEASPARWRRVSRAAKRGPLHADSHPDPDFGTVAWVPGRPRNTLDSVYSQNRCSGLVDEPPHLDIREVLAMLVISLDYSLLRAHC